MTESRHVPSKLVIALACVSAFAGCQHTAGPPVTPPNAAPGAPAQMEEATAAARKSGLPLVVLAVDPSRDEKDRAAVAAFRSARSAPRAANAAVFSLLELTDSRNRALAAPLHGLDAPTLVCLSPTGVTVSRDEGAITPELVRQRVEEAAAQAPALDRRLADLNTAVDARPADVAARTQLADFLLAHHDEQQAIPHLEHVAHDEAADVSVRVRAWVALGRAHLWVVEPEKARHAAQALMATLGPRSAEAMAGGNLVRGLQDTKARRYDRAGEELRAAVAVSPASDYGREAAELLAKLPGGRK